MSIKLHTKALEHARQLVHENKVDHQYGQGKESMHGIAPQDALKYLTDHSAHDYGLWFLGMNTHAPENSPEHYLYPIGDFKVLHRALVEKVAKQALKDHHHEIAQAAEELLKKIDKK